MSSSVHVDNKKKDILILGEGPTQVLDGVTLTAEKMYSNIFAKSKNKFLFKFFCFVYLFVNGAEIINFKAKDSENVATPLYLGSISRYNGVATLYLMVTFLQTI